MDEIINSKNSIMIIDDSKLILSIVEHILESEYIVYSCLSGKEAFPIILEKMPDLILLDLEMPDLNGFDVIKILSEDPRTCDIPIIFLTAKNDLDFETQAFSLGAMDYIVKPFAAPLLLKRVELHISLAMHKRLLNIYNKNLKQIVNDKIKIIQELQSAIVETMANLVEMRDATTGGHVHRIPAYYKLILHYLNEQNIYQDLLGRLDEKQILEASQLHDIGKVAIPDYILLKEGQLTPDEFEIMKTHTTIGEKAISKAMESTHNKTFLKLASIITISHHEKWDGTGYPKGISGDDIHIVGRIMSIVDVYDALTSDRPYRERLSHEKAAEIIESEKGTHFDPILVESFSSLKNEFKKISQKSVNI